MNRVAVTGSHGYIGSVLRMILSDHGVDVYACDNRSDIGSLPVHCNSYTKSLLRCSFDEDEFIYTVIAGNIDTIYHLAGTSLVGPDATDPLLYYWNNTARTATMLKKLTDRGWRGHIIFSSTAAVYGSSDQPLRETDITAPNSVYGASKLLTEQILATASKYGINTTTFRFFNVAGALDEMGEEHEDTHLISRLCVAALNHSTVSVFGTDYPTSDGTCIRDYVDVCDICRALIYAANNGIYGTYNLGTKTGTSVLDMISIFNEVTGRNVSWQQADRRPGDVPSLTADSTEFQRTGFKYKYNVRDVIKSSWDYFRKAEYGF